MIKVITEDISIQNDGVAFDVLVEIAQPKFFPEEVRNHLFKAELSELLINVYKKYPDIVLDAISEVCKEAVDDETDINNN